ncbi:MAG: triose-phosphate isomerase [Phaeodactylibacter sp.]|nr:triose-phosphate isomerase [Phaeodactylibacter sp.]
MSKQRKYIVAGNWKMHKQYEQGRELALAIMDKLQPSENLVILGTPFIHLKAVSLITHDISNVFMAAQNCHEEAEGAYTGEVSASMIRSTGTEYVILGHSERRQYFKESDELLAKKVDQALGAGLKPIFCCGEQLPIREKGTHVEHVAKQLKGGLFHLSEEAFGDVVIAYEPVWAIGTGKTASPEQAQEMHAAIRKLIAEQYSEDAAAGTTILYGGSVKPDNAESLFSQEDVDGGLVGGASLKVDDFVEIVRALEKVTDKWD